MAGHPRAPARWFHRRQTGLWIRSCAGRGGRGTRRRRGYRAPGRRQGPVQCGEVCAGPTPARIEADKDRRPERDDARGEDRDGELLPAERDQLVTVLSSDMAVGRATISALSAAGR